MKVENLINVHTKGYIRLVDKLGDDLTPVNAARVSYSKSSSEYSEKDSKLLDYLIRESHTSPFRHAVLQFEIYAPLMVARQWWKYVVGSSHQETMNAWNESSRRYITEDTQYYVPQFDEWRSMPDNMKQGSGLPVDTVKGEEATRLLLEQIEIGENNYNWAIENGIATEQARLFLSSAYGLYVRWYWTASLQSVLHFLSQRLDSHAQYEIREYAKAVLELTKKSFPNIMEKIKEL